MYRNFIAFFLAAGALVPTAALAQDEGESRGPYAVVRAGLGIDADLRLKAADVAAPSAFRESADGKKGWTGEVGLGYDLGGFRVEATAGYARNVLNRKTTAQQASFDAGGRLSKLDFMLNGYVDLIPSSKISPYIGAGIGVARITSKLERTAGLVGGTRLNDKDWGFSYQGNAGIAFKLSDKATVDVGIRHQRVTGVNLDGQIGSPVTARKFNTSYRSTSALIGLRFGF